MTQEERRKQKYPDTECFHYHNQNPKKKITTDCVCRAISTATGIDYNQVVRELAEVQVATGYDFAETKCINYYLKSKGWEKQKCPKHSDNTRYTGKEFCSYLKKDHKNIIMNIGTEHISCIINQRIYDTWNCSQFKVGNYWIKVD